MNKIKKIPNIDSIFSDSNTGWTVSIMNSYLMEIDFGNKEMKYLTELPVSYAAKFRNHVTCVKVDSELFFLPNYDNTMLCYSLKNGDISKIIIDADETKGIRAFHYIVNGDYLYFMSNQHKTVYQINIKNKTVDNKFKIFDGNGTIVKSNLMDGSKFSALSDANDLYIFNIENKEIIKEHLPIEDALCILAYDGNYFWLTGHKKQIYRYDYNTKQIKTINGFPSDFGEYDFLGTGMIDVSKEYFEVPVFLEIINTKHGIWFFPFQANYIIYTKDGGDTIKYIELPDEEENLVTIKRPLNSKYSVLCCRDDSILLYSQKNNAIYNLNLINGILEVCDYFISVENHIRTFEVLTESDINLRDYVDIIVSFYTK